MNSSWQDLFCFTTKTEKSIAWERYQWGMFLTLFSYPLLMFRYKPSYLRKSHPKWCSDKYLSGGLDSETHTTQSRDPRDINALYKFLDFFARFFWFLYDEKIGDSEYHYLTILVHSQKSLVRNSSKSFFALSVRRFAQIFCIHRSVPLYPLCSYFLAWKACSR